MVAGGGAITGVGGVGTALIVKFNLGDIGDIPTNPICLVRILLPARRDASRASDETTKW
jgi:hypothetical protein